MDPTPSASGSSKDFLSRRKRRKLSHFSHFTEREKTTIVNVYEYVKESWPVNKYPYRQEMKKTTADIFGISMSSVYRVLKDVETGTVKPKAPSSCLKPLNKKGKVDKTSECDDDDDSDTEDEYDVWAKECALELRQMNPEQQTFAKRAISYILMEGRLGLLHRNSVQISNTRKIPDDRSSQDPKDSLLDEFLVIRQGDPGSTVTASHKTAEDCSSATFKPPDKTRVSSSLTTPCKAASLSDFSSFDNTRSSFSVASHKTAAPVGSSSSFAKTKPFYNTESSLAVARQEISAPVGLPPLFVKAEPCADTGSSSHEIELPVGSSPPFVKTEINDDIGSSLHATTVSVGSSFLVIRQGDPGSTVTASHKTAEDCSSATLKPPDKTRVTSSLTTPCKVASLSDFSTFDNTVSSFSVASHKTAAPVHSSSSFAKTKPFYNIESSLAVARQEISAPVGLSPRFVKAEPCADTGSSSHEIALPVGSSPLFVKTEINDDIESSVHENTVSVGSSPLLVKAEPSDDSGSTLSASPENVASIRRSPSLPKPEPHSPRSSPDFTGL